MSENKELNRKLAEFAGIKVLGVVLAGEPRGSLWPEIDMTGFAVYPNETRARTLCNFPEDETACFKWLVPLAIDKIMAEQECSSDVAYAILFKKWLQELELIIPEAALALCLAIEKLIDQQHIL